jgi:hypothetical protein
MDGSICKLFTGCNDCVIHDAQLTELVNLESVGLHGTPEHARLKQSIEQLQNDMSYALRLYQLAGRHISWADQYFMSWTNQIAIFIRERIQEIKGIGIDFAGLTQSQRASWEQFAADPPPVLIMYRSFIAQATTNTDPPRAAHGNRESSLITCAGHC